MQRRIVGIISASLLLLAGCGGGDGDDTSAEPPDEARDADDGAGRDADEEAYVQAVAVAMLEDEADLDVDEATAACLAGATVDLVGVDALTDASVTPEELAAADSYDDLDVAVPDDASDRLAGDLAECDIAGMMRDSILAEFAGDGFSENLSSRAAECLDGVLDNDVLAAAVGEMYLGGSEVEFERAGMRAFAECPEVMAAVLMSETGGSVTPAHEECVTSVLEANGDMLEAMAEDPENSGGGTALAELVANECPGVGG